MANASPVPARHARRSSPRSRAIVGRGRTWSRRAADLERYGHDESEDLFAPRRGRGASRGRPTRSRAVLALATRARVPVTPARRGHRPLGRRAPGLRRDRPLRATGWTASSRSTRTTSWRSCSPASSPSASRPAVEARGLYYPPDPASRGSCTIGGNVAENAGGPHCVKYGLTKDYVLALEGVIARRPRHAHRRQAAQGRRGLRPHPARSSAARARSPSSPRRRCG